MRDRLAERLLAEVMDWSIEDVARERPILQSMAKYKYDEYQKFSPGMRFIESFALWLGQFKDLEERRSAYDFVRDRLIFISNDEMTHFVEMAYPDLIEPHLIARVAREKAIEPWKIKKIKESDQFQTARRKTLFLGLSDGSRIDLFRRSNPELTHEQIYLTYEVADDRADSLLKKLAADLALQEGEEAEESIGFETVVLLDDFSGSGISYMRKGNDGPDGKVVKFFNSIADRSRNISKLIHREKTQFILVLYIATEQAQRYFESMIASTLGEWTPRFTVDVVNALPDAIRLAPDRSCELNPLIENYYDKSLEDKHTDLGGDGVRFGFGLCGLPLILPHNTPNNSLALLWGDSKNLKALFPRVSRHK